MITYNRKREGLAFIFILFIFGSGNVLANPEMTQTIRREFLEEKIARYIDNALPDFVLKHQIEFRNLPDSIIAPYGMVDLKIEHQTKSVLKGNVLLKLQLFVDQNYIEKFRATIKLKTYEQVIVAGKDIEQHKKIERDDIRIDCQETTKLTRTLAHSIDDMLGCRSKRFINADKIIHDDMVEPLPLVERGDVVTLIFRHDNIYVTVLGKALDDGIMHDIIDVRNLDSQKRLKGEVIDEKKVLVQ